MPTDLAIHPDMQVLIAAKAAHPAGETVAEMREAWSCYSAMTSQPSPDDMRVEDATISPPGGGPRVSVRWYYPAKMRSPPACVIYLHGGGFMKGDLDSSDTVAWGIAEDTGAAVVSVDYRLAPEHPYPAALDDCLAVLRHAASRDGGIDIDATRIVLWGDSAGGNLAAACCLAARDGGGPAIAAQVLVYPCLTDRLTASSYVDYADSPGLGLTTRAMDLYWGWYLGDRRPTDDPCAAPLAAGNFEGLPPAFVHIAEFDPLADDGRDYTARLQAAGVVAELRCAERMIHGFLRTRFTGDGGAAEWRAVCNWVRSRLA